MLEQQLLYIFKTFKEALKNHTRRKTNYKVLL